MVSNGVNASFVRNFDALYVNNRAIRHEGQSNAQIIIGTRTAVILGLHSKSREMWYAGNLNLISGTQNASLWESLKVLKDVRKGYMSARNLSRLHARIGGKEDSLVSSRR